MKRKAVTRSPTVASVKIARLNSRIWLLTEFYSLRDFHTLVKYKTPFTFLLRATIALTQHELQILALK